MTVILEEGYQTYLQEFLPLIRQEVERLNWLVTNLECWGELSPLIENWQSQSYDSEPYYSLVPGKVLYETFVGRDLQVVWGVLCGVAGDIPTIPLEEVPYANGNRRIWTNPKEFQLAGSEIEIVAFDSTFTLVKMRDEMLGHKFLKVFPKGRIIQNPDDMLQSYQ